jgi:autotransporter-associated beta strand protein
LPFAAVERRGTALPARRRRNGRLAALLATTALVAVAALLPGVARAVDTNATWLLHPGSNDFNTATNWNPATVPSGTAFFDTSSTTSLSFSPGTTTQMGGWTFNAGASSYSFTIPPFTPPTFTSVVFTGAGIVINGGSATITNNERLSFQGSSSTAGTATIANNGLLDFQNASTADSATITNNRTLIFTNSSTAGSATITTNTGGRTFLMASASGGAARFILNDTGLLDISALSSTGTTAGSIEGAGNVFLGSKNLAIGGNNLSTIFAGVIQDGGIPGGTGGSLTKTGSGTLTLSGVNTYSGATSVNAGTLSVNGSIASSVLTTVNAGGTLGGNGIVGNTTINGGALSPGNSIGLLTVQGSLAFTAASSYMVEVSPANADRTNVTGTATLGGATVNASFAAGGYVAKQYTILNATGGVNGTFAGPASSNLPANFQTSLSYDANNAYLNLTATLGTQQGLPGNQQNVANAINSFFNGGGAVPPGFVTLFGLTGGNLSSALSQASGETATGTQQTTFDAMNLFLGLLTDPFIAGRGDPVSAGSAAPQFAEDNDSASAYAANGKARSKSERDAYAAVYRKAPVIVDPFAQRWSVWAAGYGGSQTTDGNAALGSNTATSRIAGGVVGADYRFSPFTLAGFALAGGGTSFSIANGLGGGRSDLFQAGAFVRHAVGPAYISAALAYGWQDITTDRTVTIAGVDRLRAQFNANAWSGRVEGGYRFVTPWMGITPYAAGQFTTFDLPAYAETAVSGANTFALGYAAKDVTASRSELGLRTDNSWAMQNAILTLRGRFAWAHNFNPDRNIAATFQTLPGASFVVNGAAQARDAALTTASAEVKWINGWSAAATFEGEFSNVTRSYAGKGVVRYQW